MQYPNPNPNPKEQTISLEDAIAMCDVPGVEAGHALAPIACLSSVPALTVTIINYVETLKGNGL
jgi:hypothetical protein